MLENLLPKLKWHIFVFHGVQQFIHRIMQNRFLWWFIVCNMALRFAFLSVGKEAWLKSTVTLNPLLFYWRYFCTKTCSSKDMNHLSNTLWTLPSLELRNCSLTTNSLPTPRDSAGTYSTLIRWAPLALPMSVSVLKLLLSTMTIGGFPYAMPRGQVLEVSTSRKVKMTYKRRR